MHQNSRYDYLIGIRLTAGLDTSKCGKFVFDQSKGEYNYITTIRLKFHTGTEEEIAHLAYNLDCQKLGPFVSKR